MKIIEKIIVFIIGLFVIATIVALPVMLLWNAIIPDIFGLKEITFWQALGLSILSSLLFKSDNSK